MSGILSPATTLQILESLGHQPKKKLGQNFLIDGNIVRKSLEIASLQKGDCIVEIGPGLGTLTSALLESGAHVYAVEKDQNLYNYLKSSILLKYKSILSLINEDALEYPLADLPAEIAAKGFKIIANLPYAISTPWMDAVLKGPLPTTMTMMLQQEAADRFTADPGTKTFGAISIFIKSAYERKQSYKVARQCFYPVPKVDSTLLHLELKKDPFLFKTQTRSVIRDIFTQKRKQIQSICKQHARSEDLKTWLEQLENEGNDLKQRPETISIKAWQNLNNLL